VHWIKAQLAGAGGLVADVFQTYPRAYHTAHLYDGIMETIVTNWGNDGIQTDMLGPALAGTDDVTGVPSPLKRILLSDQFLWFGAAIAIDFSPLQNQINALAAQQLEDATAFSNFSTAITAELEADETQIAANQTAIAALQTALTAANAQIASLQQQIIVLAQTGRYYPSAVAQFSGQGSLTATLRMRAFLAPTVLMGAGNLVADPFVGRPISADFAGEGGLTAYLSGPHTVVPRLMTGVGSLTANLSVGKHIDSPDFAGAGTLTARLTLAGRLVPSQFAGVGSVTADLFGPVQFLLAQTLAGKGSLTATLVKDLSGAVLSGEGSLTATLGALQTITGSLSGEGAVTVSEAMQLALAPAPMAGTGALTAVPQQWLALMSASPVLSADGIQADIDLNFATDFGWNQGAPGSSTAPLTVVRASVGYAQDSSGNFIQFGNNVARRTDLGLLSEEARTNSIRNNSMQGAVTGTPGTMPTNWTVTNGNGLTRTITGVGTENGINYIEYTFTGTAAAVNVRFNCETATQIAAASGQTWTNSLFYRYVGSTSNATGIRALIFGNTAAGAINETFVQSIADTSLSTTWTRISLTSTLANASTAFVAPYVDLLMNSGTSVSFTIRIGWPQLELGAFATSPIVTTGSAATRARDAIAVTGLTVGSAVTIYGQGLNSGTTPVGEIVGLSDATINNRHIMFVSAGGSVLTAATTSGGTSLFGGTVGGWTIGTKAKAASAFTAGSGGIVLNGGTVTTTANAGALPTLTRLDIGSQIGSANFWNSYVTRVGAWLNNRISNTGLQAVTSLTLPTPLAGAGALSAKLSSNQRIAATYAGAGGLNANVGFLVALQAALAGQGGFVAPDLLKLLGPAALAGSGSLLADTQQLAVINAAYAGVGGLNASVANLLAVNANFGGTGGFVAPSLRGQLGVNAGFAGQGGMSAPALIKGKFISAALAPRGGLTANVTQSASFSALDPVNSDTGISLSNSNRTAAWTGSTGYAIARGTKVLSTGKKYFEITITSLSNASSYIIGGGIVRSNWVPGTFEAVGSSAGGDNWGVAASAGDYQLASNDANGNTGFASALLGITPATNDTIMIAMDLGTGNIFVGVNNNWVRGLTPAGGTGAFTTPTTGSFYPAVSVDNFTATNRVTINVGNAAFKYTLPSGYTAWG
jgi:hypothetical protein